MKNKLYEKDHHFLTVMSLALQFFLFLLKPCYSANLCYNLHPKDFKNGGSALKCGCTKIKGGHYDRKNNKHSSRNT